MKTYGYGKQSISWSDIWSVVQTLRSPHLTQGPKIQEFERALCAYTGAKYAVVVANGTAALHLATLALDIKPGDEGITSPITFLASANCIAYPGGTVKFADVEPSTANIDVHEIAKQITPRTKVIIPVHFAGQSCDMEAIADLARKHNIRVIEDAAHAIGSTYKGHRVGSCRYSDMTIFSFHPVKTITTAEGGAITTNNPELYSKLLELRTIGVRRDPARMTKTDGPWYYEMHELGFNYRMTDMQAALGVSQLKRLDQFVAQRRAIVEQYRTLFAGDARFSLLEEKAYSKAAFHLCPLLINFDFLPALRPVLRSQERSEGEVGSYERSEERSRVIPGKDPGSMPIAPCHPGHRPGIHSGSIPCSIKKSKQEIFAELKAKGLNLQVHYIPVHLQPYYQHQGFKPGDYPNAERYYQQALSLPLYPGLTAADVKHIVDVIKEVVG